MPAPLSKKGGSVHVKLVVKIRREALAACGRGTNEKLGFVMTNDGFDLNKRRKNAHLHQYSRNLGCLNRRRRVHRNAKRAMVGSGFIRVDVRHLDNCEQRQQHEAQDRDHAQSSGLREPGLCTCVHTDLRLESCQKPSPALRIQVIRRKITRNGWTTPSAQATKPPEYPLPTQRRSSRLNCVR